MKEVIYTENAPQALGPYSQGIKIGNLLFTAGQVALNPSTGDMNNATIEDEVHHVRQFGALRTDLLGLVTHATLGGAFAGRVLLIVDIARANDPFAENRA